jgi:coenzyme PQQ precursor peptide PqqA
LRYRFSPAADRSSVRTTRQQELRTLRRPSGRLPIMTWTTPTLVEICIGLEINGYLPAEF